jgi:long-chain acyl-CoA synthetase
MSDKNHPWFNFYPSGVSHQINPDQYNSIPDLLEESFDRYKEKTAFINMGKELSFAQLDQLSRQFASYLTNEVGLEKGDRIAIQMPNLLQYPVALFGALRAGLIVVNTNPLYTPHEMKHQFNDSGAKAVIILANFASKLEKILPDTSIETVIVTEIGDMLGGFKKLIVNFVVKNVKKMVPAYSLPGAIKFNSAVDLGAKHTFTKADISINDVAFLQYTGGTTGVSKGASLSHRNIVANLLQCKEWFVGMKEGGEVAITALPLYHIFALTVNCMLMTNVGAKNILITNPRDMPAFIKDLKKYPFTIITGVNTLFNGLLHQPDFVSIDFSNLKYAIGGGMAVQRAVAEKWKEVTGCTLAEGYGLSETSPLLTCNPLDGSERIGTIGLPAPSTELKIMDEDGTEIPLGEAGEICSKGPQVMSGYWERPDETAKVFHGDWFRTGDIGVIDEDGFFKVVDRKKDMINVSGFNVYPNEIEDVVASHDKVLEVAAIGVEDEKSTEAVKLFVVKKDSSLTEDELKEYCKEYLTNYKRPKFVEFREELPKSNVGKILRRHLREAETG